MLQALFGNRTAEKVLLYLAVNSESYTQELADNLTLPLFAVQRQLRRLEEGGIVVAQARGRMRFFSLNPRLPFTPDLTRLLTKALDYMPATERSQYQPRRRRPRRTGKPA
jgi:DNA-binding transcriptional ArsR family regulator